MDSCLGADLCLGSKLREPPEFCCPRGTPPPRTTDLPIGKRISSDSGGSFRADANGTGYFYMVLENRQINGIGSFLTDEPDPTTPPGDLA